MQTTLPMGSILRERYIVEGLLGKGGFGAVYLVKDVRVQGNLYALKEAINPQRRDRERFVFEGELLKHLDHRSLPRVYRIFEDDTNHRAYLLMDFIEGPNLEVLRQLQPDKHFSLQQVLKILAPIVDAVNYLHHQNPPILHRDIKPSNIIVPVSGDDAVLVDFGIAKEFNPDATTTAFRTGSPGYAPPELYSTGTSTRSDIYELGATFYTLLTGSVPVDALHRIALIGSGQPDPLEPINKLDLAVPQSVANAIHHALSINSNHRFHNLEEFWLAIDMQPGWRPLHKAVVALSAPSTQLIASNKNIDTPMPAVVTIHKQAQARRSRKFWLWFLVLLLIVVLSGIGAVLYSYFAKYPVANSIASTSQAQANTTVSATVSPTSLPTQASTQAVPTAHSKSTPTSLPVVIPTPRPTPSPTPRPIPYPTVAGNYNGTVDDTTSNTITGMALAIQQQAGHGAINGYFTVNPPLVGSGSFTGSVNTNNYIQFVVQAYKKNSALYFWGWLKSNRILSGDYCSLNKQNQCDPNAGASGTWSAAPAAH
ncbi:MAG TPA: serine/threonine-protein kinase [Ktedonobacteraceae bacterium]